MNEICDQVGIFDKVRYYGNDTGDETKRLTIRDTINLDFKLIEEKTTEGFDPKSLKTFLIGGCFSSTSIESMVDFINQINPEENVTLLVTDMNREAIDLIQHRQPEIPKNISLKMFQGDLTELGLPPGSVDYIRTDYTQNFIAPGQQKKFLREIKRVMSDGGIFASVMEMCPSAKDWIEEISRAASSTYGSKIDTHGGNHFGINIFVPTEEYLNKLADMEGFTTSVISENIFLRKGVDDETKLVAFEKQLHLSNFDK